MMEVEVGKVEGGEPESEENDEMDEGHDGDDEEGGRDETERSRPTTPSKIFDIIPKNEDEWWRPSHPPETYMWEEVRRQRQKGGYPWTLLDKDDEENENEIDFDDYLDDNLYEPVNPPPLYGTGSSVLGKDQTDTGSLDGRRIHIPPEIEIVNSEGLDGLDKPDPHDHGFDGDREWTHSDDEHGQSSKVLFTAGIRGKKQKSSDSDSNRSSIRPLTNKMISFDPATSSRDNEGPEEAQVVPDEPTPTQSTISAAPKKTTTAFEILKNKASGAAGQMKQHLTKIALPVRPKFNQWEGVKLARKKPRKKASTPNPEADQEVPQDEGEEAETDATRKGMSETPIPEEEPGEPATSKEAAAEALRKEKEAAADALRQEKEAAAEEKRKKQKEADELKKQKAEEKKKEQEELKRQKAEEKQKAKEEADKKKEEADKKKAEEKAAKQKASEEAKRVAEEAKKAKLEEQLAKAREVEEQERRKNEELLRLREQEAAEAAAHASEMQEEGEQEAEHEQEVPTPTGTGKRKKIKKTFVQLPQLPKMPDMPHIDLDFKRKVIKRSKTPPGRPQPPKSKLRRGVEDTENQLAAQYADELEARKIEMEEEDQEEAKRGSRMNEPPIFVTQPSTEPFEETESHVAFNLAPSTSGRKGQPDEPTEEKKGPATKERLEKMGQQLKGFGIKSKEMASKKSKAMGVTMKVIGKDLQKFGVKTSEKFQATIEEIKAKQEAAKARSKEKAKEAEDIEREVPMDVEINYQESGTEPRRKFRFRRRDESQEEQDESADKSAGYFVVSEGPRSRSEGEEKVDEDRRTRSQLLGRAERDWESPLDLQHSRDVSEEPFSGEASSRDSPPGSSMASSTFAHARKQGGVLEEIDSDEFFLREKGISEGEDEDEINRFLVEELRQAFRAQDNSLAGFDLVSPPLRPDRLPRKPPRKEKGDTPPSYQTFPPERPRRKTPGYVSEYMQEHGDEMEEDQSSNQEERGSFQGDVEEIDDEGVRRVKQELQKIEQEDGQEQGDGAGVMLMYDDDGRYEPVSEEPVKPARQKKPQKMVGPLYYNTVAGNEWMRDVDDQFVQQSPDIPHRDRSKRSKSGSQSRNEGEIPFADRESPISPIQGRLVLAAPPPLAQAESEGRIDDAEIDFDENFEYVDEAGYAVVQKGRETPRTAPRRKKRGGSKGSSLKRQEDQEQSMAMGGSEPTFFSLPRQAPRALHIVPPSRPQRTYSTLKPRRPPRHKSNQSLTKSKGNKGDSARPSTAIGIMQGRPLPAPPRPSRSPMNDLDQTSIERAVGARHYANFGSNGSPREVVDNVASNIPVPGMTAGDINVAIQTDPFQEELDNQAAAAVTSFEDVHRRVQKQSDSPNTTATNDRDSRPQRQTNPSAGPQSQAPHGQPSHEPFVFPRRLHLDELEVDVLRVNDLSAHSITVEHLHSPQLEVNSLTSLGPLSVSSIHTQTLNSDQINCNRLSSDTVDLPTVVPPSFYNLAPHRPAPTNQSQPEQPPVCEETPEQLRLASDDKEENDSIYPYAPFEESEVQYENLEGPLKTDLSFECQKDATPSEDFFLSARDVEFCLTPEQSVEIDDSWDRSGHMDECLEQTDASLTQPQDDVAHCSELQEESCEQSAELSSLNQPNEELSAEMEKSEEIPVSDVTQSFTLEQIDDFDTPTQTLARFQTLDSLHPQEDASEVPSEPEVLQSTDPGAERETNQSTELSRDEPDRIVLNEPICEQNLSDNNMECTDDDLVHEEEIIVVNKAFFEPVQESYPEQTEPEKSTSHLPHYEPEEEIGTTVFTTITSFDTHKEIETPVYPSSRSFDTQEDPELVEDVEECEPQVIKIIFPVGSPSVDRSSTSSSKQHSIESESVEEQQSTPPTNEATPAPEESVPTSPSGNSDAGPTQIQEIREDMMQTGIRLAQSIARFTIRSLQSLVDYIDIATTDDPAKAEEQKAHMQVLLCVLLILVAGIMLSSNSDISPPRWQFLMNPPNL